MDEPRYFRVRNFDKYQHYKHRNPPWVKLYRSIFEDFRFVKLNDVSKLAVIASTSLASCYQNRIPFDPEWFRLVTHIEGDPDWFAIFESMMCEPIDWNYKELRSNDSNLLAQSRDRDRVETEAETELGSLRSPTAHVKRSREDAAYEIWARVFAELRNAPYQNKRGDFVRLAALRKVSNENGHGCPKNWEVAVRNYLSSPLPAFTLADLCSRFDVFVNGEVDRYGRPAGFNDIRQHNKATVMKLQEKGFF